MPNFCSVTMMVEAEDTDKGIEQFTEFYNVLTSLSATQGFLDAYVPMPEAIKSDRSMILYTNWVRSNWSSRNDVPKQDIIIEETGFNGSVILRFDTEWNPPKNFIINLGRKYQAVKFAIAFSEAGFNQAGLLVVENGAIVATENINVEFDKSGIPTGKYAEFLNQYELHTGG